jgi:drug/metabolite transporter (DMT)-like permease
MTLLLEIAFLCSSLILARDRGDDIGQFLVNGGIGYLAVSVIALCFIAIPIAFVVAIHARRYANQVGNPQKRCALGHS